MKFLISLTVPIWCHPGTSMQYVYKFLRSVLGVAICDMARLPKQRLLQLSNAVFLGHIFT